MVSPVGGMKGADGENQRGGAVPVHGADPYLGWSQTRSGGSWDNPAGDQVCVVATQPVLSLPVIKTISVWIWNYRMSEYIIGSFANPRSTIPLYIEREIH
jgi:hypothetical protein